MGMSKDLPKAKWSAPYEIFTKAVPKGVYPSRGKIVWKDPKDPSKPYAGYQHLDPKLWVGSAQRIPGIDKAALDIWHKFAESVLARSTPEWLAPDYPTGPTQLERLIITWKGIDDDLPILLGFGLPADEISASSEDDRDDRDGCNKRPTTALPVEDDSDVYSAPYSGPRRKRRIADVMADLLTASGPTQNVPYTEPKIDDFVMVGIQYSEDEEAFRRYNPNQMPEPGKVVKLGRKPGTVMVSVLKNPVTSRFAVMHAMLSLPFIGQRINTVVFDHQVHWLITKSGNYKMSGWFREMPKNRRFYETEVRTENVVAHGFQVSVGRGGRTYKLSLKIRQEMVKYCKEVGIRVEAPYL